MIPTLEVNFDSLVGPTHNYAGLAQGNLASQQHKNLTSHPRAAALQGLEKMHFLASLGIPQAVLPPHERPHIAALRQLGFTGSETQVLERAARDAPHLLAACSSSSFMWAANAATVSPSADTTDHLLHITPANLQSHLHRSLETPTTASILRHIFPGPLFSHHAPLPATPALSDEGAANHSRLCSQFGDPGLELFTFGRDTPHSTFAPRQSLLASQSLARLHQLDPARTFFLQQSPAAIDAGVFHNDVIALAHQHVFLYHEHAYADLNLDQFRRAFAQFCHAELLPLSIPASVLSLADAVRSYLFNSQLVTLPDQSFLFLAPTECQHIPAALAAINFIRDHAPIISQVSFIDVHQSMQNGGGPACLRLRVVLTDAQRQACPPGIFLTDPLYHRLSTWITHHYREDLTPADLADPHLLMESRTALRELASILAWET